MSTVKVAKTIENIRTFILFLSLIPAVLAIFSFITPLERRPPEKYLFVSFTWIGYLITGILTIIYLKFANITAEKRTYEKQIVFGCILAITGYGLVDLLH